VLVDHHDAASPGRRPTLSTLHRSVSSHLPRRKTRRVPRNIKVVYRSTCTPIKKGQWGATSLSTVRLLPQYARVDRATPEDQGTLARVERRKWHLKDMLRPT